MARDTIVQVIVCFLAALVGGGFAGLSLVVCP
jgi:hypothetical protein